MRSQIEAGVIYLGLAAGIAALWLTGSGARFVQAIRDAASGAPSLTLRVPSYRPSGGAGGGRKP